MEIYYKATRPDGTDFYTGTVNYVAALESGTILRHPRKGRRQKGDASTYFSVSVEPADCMGAEWPCRLFQVEPVGPIGTAFYLPNKRTCKALRVRRELPAWQALGPNGQQVAAFLGRCLQLTPDECKALAIAWDAAWYAAWDAARYAAWDAARYAARYAAWNAAGNSAWANTWANAKASAWDSALALVVRDLISEEYFNTLTQPWRDAIGATWEEVN